MGEYRVCVITKLEGIPPEPVPIAAVIWGASVVEVIAPTAPAIETIIRSFLAGIDGDGVHPALIAFGSASHPYGIGRPETFRSATPAHAGLAALQIRSLGGVGSKAAR